MAPSFRELALRLAFNDLGLMPNEYAPIQNKMEDFIAAANQSIFIVSINPLELFEPIVLLDGVFQYRDTNYTVNERTFTFPDGVIIAGQIIKVEYQA